MAISDHYRRAAALGVILAAAVAGGGAAQAASQARAGLLVAKRECGVCHAVEPGTSGPLDDAPRFEDLRRAYSTENFERLLAERMQTSHPRMPPLRLDPDELANLISYWTSLPASPEPKGVLRGRAVANRYCASCHGTDAGGAGARVSAPSLRNLSGRYPVADLVGAIAEGAPTSHPAMPRFRLSFEDAQDLIAYIRSIQR